MNRKPPHSTGLRPLSEPLPRYPTMKKLIVNTSLAGYLMPMATGFCLSTHNPGGLT